LVATYFEARWFFIFGFSKNEKSNITAKELQWLMIFAQQLLGLNEHELSIAIEVGELYEIKPESAQSNYSRNASQHVWLGPSAQGQQKKHGSIHRVFSSEREQYDAFTNQSIA